MVSRFNNGPKLVFQGFHLWLEPWKKC